MYEDFIVPPDASSSGPARQPSAPARSGGNVESFVETYMPVAQRVSEKTGVAPEALLGQWGLETGWGKSVIPGTNNLGNIKDFSGRGPAAVDNMTKSKDSYMAFGSPDEFGDHYAGLLSRRYKSALNSSDPESFFAELKRGGYAEDPLYVQKGVAAANMVTKALGGSVTPVAPKQESSEYFVPQRGLYSSYIVPPERTFGQAAADAALGAASGVVQGVGLLAGAAGADNVVAKGASELSQSLMDMQSPQRKAERQERARLISDAEASGSTWEEIKANVGAFLDAPVETSLNALGTSAPTILMSFIPGLGQANAARLILQGAAGAAQGAGAVKGSIYEQVKQKVEADLVKSGMDKAQAAEEAEKVAVGAQAYDGQNGGQIALGTILGVAAGTIGVEGALSRTGLAKSVPGRMAVSAISESIPEAAQGGQERLATNIALQNEGFDVPTYQGVAGQAAMEGIASMGPGAAFGAISRPPELQAAADKAAEPNSPLSKAAIAGADAAPAQPEAPKVDPVQRLAELEAIGKGTEDEVITGPDGNELTIPGEPGRFFTTEEKAEYDQLVALRDATPGMTPEDRKAAEDKKAAEQPKVDTILDRARGIEQMLRTNDGLAALRSDESPVTVNAFLSDLARAKSKSTPAAAREQALARLESTAEWLGFDLAALPSGETPQNAPAESVAPETPSGRPLSPEAQAWMATREPGQQTVLTRDQVRNREATEVVSRTELLPNDRRAAIEALNTHRNTNLPQRTRQEALNMALEIVGRNTAPTSQTPAQQQTPAVLGEIKPQPNTPAYFESEAQRREEGAWQFRQLGFDDEANALLAEADSLRENAASARAGELGMEDNPEADVVAPAKAQTVDQATQGLGRPNIPAATDADVGEAGTAMRRRRKGQFQQLAGIGFDTVERRDNGFVFVNTKTKQEVTLESPADAQMARVAVKEHVDALANTAAASPKNDRLEPTPAQIEAGNYKKSDVIDINGVKVRIENPAGSTRRGVAPDGTPWETTMVHHYGEIVGTEGVDGDRVDVLIGKRPDSKRVWVVDQVNPDGTFDEHKTVFGAVSEEDARQTYLANYEKGWTGLGAITEVPPVQLKRWLRNHAKRPAAEILYSPITVTLGGKDKTVSPLPVDALPTSSADSRARGNDDGPMLTQRQAVILKGIAGVFGKDVVFFDDPKKEVNADGFIRDDDLGTIYIGTRTSVSPIAVLGHELMHILRSESPAAYAAIAKVVESKVKNAKGYRSYYKGTPLKETKAGALKDSEIEELASDLNGNLMTDPTFWKEVFDEIQAANGEKSKGIIAQLSAFVQKVIDAAVKAFSGQTKFRSETFVNDMAAIREAYRKGLAQYAQSQGITKAGMQAEIVRAGKASGNILRSPQRQNDGLTVEAYHFSKQPRQILSTGFYGSGLQGLEREAVMASDDKRLRDRLYFYVNKGTGVRPESGVGGIAHKATLTNIYDADADMRRLRQGRDLRGFESAVLNAGYSGYMSRMMGTQPGTVVLLGSQTVQPEILGLRTQIEDAKPVPAPAQRPMDLGDKILANKALPAGQMSGEQWAKIMMATMPEEAAKLLDAGVFDSGMMYRSDLAAKARSMVSDIRRSTQRAKDEYAEVEAKLKGTDQWMKAPNGDATDLTERQWVQVRTPSFKKWFGDWEAAYKAGGVWSAKPGTVSTVVGDNGEPLVVYHGSNNGGFVEFMRPAGTQRGDLGIFTTSNYNMAASYVRRNRARDVELPADPQSKADLEALDFSFDETDDGKVEVTAPDGYFQGSYESMDDAVKDTIDNFEMPDLTGTRPGVYALFVNIRNPNESDFEGANWDGQRMGQFQVLDENDEPIYNTDGRAYFDDEDQAQELAELNGGRVERADDHYETTDSVVRDARRSNNDGAAIRGVVDDGGGGGSYGGEPSDVFVAFEPNQIKSADYNGGEFREESDDIRRTTRRKRAEDVEERVRFNKAKADQKVDPRRVPEFRFSDHIGRFMFPTISDRTAAGGVYAGIDGAGADDIPQQGGPGFPLLSRNFKRGVAWANEGPAVAGRKRNIIEQYGTPLMAVTLGQLDMHKSNATAVLAYLRTLEAYIKTGRVDPANLGDVTKTIRSLKLNTKGTSEDEEAVAMVDEVVDENELAKFPGFDDTKKLHKFIDGATFAARAEIVKELGKARSEGIGLPSADKVIRKLTDPEYAGSRYLDTVLIIEPNTTDTFIKLGEGGTDKHLSYSYALKGRVVGKLSTPVNAREIWADWWADQYDRKLDEKKRFLDAYNSGDASGLSKEEFEQFSKIVKNKNRLEKLVNGQFDELISMERAFTLGMPVMKITPEIAERLDRIAGKPAPNQATARAAVAFMNNDWATSDVAKNQGGASAADFARELRQSDSAATLDLYSNQDLTEAVRGWKWGQMGGKKIKEPVQKMRLFQLRDHRIQFALKYGKPYTYEQDIPGLSDNEVTLTSVVNNEDGVNGIAGPAIMIRAIEEGATFLDAYSLTSERFPAGFLPTLYNEYGFEEVGRVAANPEYITEDHKYAWAQNGWKEGDPLPDIVMMKWKGSDEQRKGLLERYLREGASSLRGHKASSTAEGLFHELAGPGDSAQRAEPGTGGGAGGDQGAGDRASLASRAFKTVAQLRSLDDDQLRNLGLEPEQVRGKPPESGIRFSPGRLSSADKIKWRDLQDVKREISLDRLPTHVLPFADFMRYMAQKAAVGAISPRDILKAYTITRSSVNRGAISADKARSGGLQLPADFEEPTVRPEGAFSYWLLSPAGQDYLNDAELGIVNQAAIDNAVAVMKPWGMSNMLGEDLARAVKEDIGSLSLQVSYIVSKASGGEKMVGQWQRMLDNLYGIGYAKKGFMGAMLGYGQLPTFDARQINIQVEPDSRKDVLNALATNRAPEVVDTLARRLDALDLTMDDEYAPFRQHLVHHAVWDAVGKSKTTHSDVVDAMVKASPRRDMGDNIVIDFGDEQVDESTILDDIDAAAAKGRKVSYEVEVEDTGDTARMTVDAGDALADYDRRIETMTKLLECLRK